MQAFLGCSKKMFPTAGDAKVKYFNELTLRKSRALIAESLISWLKSFTLMNVNGEKKIKTSICMLLECFFPNTMWIPILLRIL